MGRQRKPHDIERKMEMAEALCRAWQTSNQATIFLVENIHTTLWNKKMPGYARKTIGMMAIHMHNVRCMWIKGLAKGTPLSLPPRIDRRLGTQKALLLALTSSDHAMLELLEQCIANEGHLPSKTPWLNFPPDVVHLVAYLVAHEAHHRGQIIMAARQLGDPFPEPVVNGVWQWKTRRNDARTWKPRRVQR